MAPAQRAEGSTVPDPVATHSVRSLGDQPSAPAIADEIARMKLK